MERAPSPVYWRSPERRSTKNRPARLAEIAIERREMRHLRHPDFDDERHSRLLLRSSCGPAIALDRNQRCGFRSGDQNGSDSGLRRIRLLVETMQAETEDFRVPRLLLDGHLPLLVDDISGGCLVHRESNPALRSRWN